MFGTTNYTTGFLPVAFVGLLINSAKVSKPLISLNGRNSQNMEEKQLE